MLALLFPSEGLFCFVLDMLPVRQAATPGFTPYLPPLSDVGVGGIGGGGGGGIVLFGNKLIVVAQMSN